MSKFYVLFENKGEVPVNAFKLLGASSKRNDQGKIGYFGTGLKYALAVLLREEIGFRVFSGSKEVKIGLRKTSFGDQKIDVMTVNGEKTSITIDAGIDWESWFAIREIYSNTIDENGTMQLNKPVEAAAGFTRIYVDADAEKLKSIFQNWNSYFTQNRQEVFINERGSLYDKLPTVPNFVVFRKGIRAYESRRHSIFDYDLPKLDINESRVAKYSWQANHNSSDLLASADLTSIKKFLSLYRNDRRREFIEWQNEFWDYTGTNSFSEHWVEALADKRVIPADFAGHYDITETSLVLPDKLIKKLKERFGDAINTAGDNRDSYSVRDNVSKEPLQKILDVYAIAGLDWTLDQVDIVDFFDKDILGMASKENRVLLSSKLFSPVHKHQIASTLMEEIVHAKTGLSDGTREMQNYLFQTIVGLSKDLAEVKQHANQS